MARSVLEQLIVELGLDASGYKEGLAGAERSTDQSTRRMSVSLRGIGQAFGVVTGVVAGAAAGFVAAANRAAAFADDIDKAALRTRLSRDSVQELRFVTDQLGGSFGNIETAVQGMTMRLAGAEQGAERQTEAFARLGIQLRDNQGELRATEDLLFDSLSALQGVTNETERSVLAQELFGRSAATLGPILSAGAGSVDELRQKAHDLGIVLDEQRIGALVAYKDGVSAIKRQFQALTVDGVGALVPVLQQTLVPLLQNFVMPALQGVSRDLQNATGDFDDLTDGQAPLVTAVQDTIVTLVNMGAILVGLGRVSAGAATVLAAPFAALGDVIGQLSVGLVEFGRVYELLLRRDFQGFWRAIQQRPIDVLLPAGGLQAAAEAAARQAQAGLDVMGGGFDQLLDVFSGALTQRVRDAFSQGAATVLSGGSGGAGLPSGVTSSSGGPVVGSGSGLTPALERTVGMVFEELADVGTQSLREATRLISVGADEEKTRVEDLRTRIRQIETTRAELLRDFYDDVTDAQLEYLVDRQRELEGQLQELLRPTRATVPLPGAILMPQAPGSGTLPAALSAPVPLPFRDLPVGGTTSVVAAMDPAAIEAARAELAAFQAALEELGRAGREQSVFQRELAAAIADPFGTAERDRLRSQRAARDTRTQEFSAAAAAAAAAAEQAQRDLNNYGLSLEELARRGREAATEQRETARAHDELTAALRRQKEEIQQANYSPAWDPFGDWSPPVRSRRDFGGGVINDSAGSGGLAKAIAAQRESITGSGVEFAQTIVQAGRTFLGLIDAIESGDTRSVIEQGFNLFGDIGAAVLPGFGALIKLGTDFFGSIFGRLFGGPREDQVQSRAAGAATRGAPSLELNLSVFQNIQTLSLAASDRAQVDGFLNDTVDAVLGVIERTIIPRLDRLEERLA